MSNTANQVKTSCKGCWASQLENSIWFVCKLNYKIEQAEENGFRIARPMEWCPKPRTQYKLVELSRHLYEQGYDKHGVPLAQGSGGGTGGFE